MPLMKKIIISHNLTVRNAVKKMDVENLNLLVVINNSKKVLGIFTMGDFRRAIFFGLDLEIKISSIINKNFEYLMDGFSKNDAKQKFIKNNLIMEIPVLDKSFKLIKIVSRSEFFRTKDLKNLNKKFKNISVVIMAGGKGTRLDPFTRILPKPLIPIGNDPIIKVIMDQFMKFGSTRFYISVNEKSHMIKSYFNDLNLDCKIKYVEEKKPLGTAGSLRLLKNILKKTFFVSNSDILIQSHFPGMLQFHKENRYDLTLISSMHNYKIPYGVCNFNKNGELKYIKEKPEYYHFVNTGLYLIEPKVLKLIPANIKFDMNDLLNKARNNKMKVGVFPISENSWSDIGEWSEYKKNINKLIF